ncbi:J domain-containing protein-like [Brevipalpus obovatus]|uniref:J domain-containing protein-like n=1 Tax=Brevipalpus obovatus TaxID=246614 RepID=UPI003D9F693C
MEDIFNYEKRENDNYYKILGCDRLSDIDQILKEYRQKVIKCHPDKMDGVTSSEEFNRIQKAKEVLTSTETRCAYDKWLDSGIAIPFDKWLAMSRNVHSSMHWMNSRQTKTMISFIGDDNDQKDEDNDGGDDRQLPVDHFIWERDPPDSEILQKFRNYEL